MIIATVVPNDYFAPWDFVRSMLNLNNKYKFLTIQSCSIADNRGLIFKRIKELKEDLLFIDSDTVFNERDVELIEIGLEQYDILGGACMLSNGKPNIFKRITGDYDFKDMEQGVFEVDAIGTGFMGISKKVIEEMPHDSFYPLKEGNLTHGTDISFCHRARKQGFRIWCDSNIAIGHIKTKILRV